MFKIFLVPLLLTAAGVTIVRFRRLDWRDDVGMRLPSLRQGAAWLAGFVIIAVVAEAISANAGLSDPRGNWIGKYNGFDLAVRMVSVALVYPVVEEFFFRGAAFGGLRQRLPGPAVVVLTATLFTFSHGQYALDAMAFVFVDGLYFGLCRWRTNALPLTMAMHVLGNSYAVRERLTI